MRVASKERAHPTDELHEGPVSLGGPSCSSSRSSAPWSPFLLVCFARSTRIKVDSTPPNHISPCAYKKPRPAPEATRSRQRIAHECCRPRLRSGAEAARKRQRLANGLPIKFSRNIGSNLDDFPWLLNAFTVCVHYLVLASRDWLENLIGRPWRRPFRFRRKSGLERSGAENVVNMPNSRFRGWPNNFFWTVFQYEYMNDTSDWREALTVGV